MLQSSVLPGTSTHRAMQEDGLIPEMYEISHLGTCVPSPRRPTARRRGFRAAAAMALICAALAGCTGEQFQKGYILPPNALEQIERELPPLPELAYLVNFVRTSERGVGK